MAITRDTILDKINEITKVATSKVGEITEKSKITFEIAEREKELAELYRELGKVVYESSKNGSDVITTETLLSIIDEKCQDLEALREKKYSRMKPICRGCGLDIDDSFDFCPKCGTKIMHPIVEEPIAHEPTVEEATDAIACEDESCGIDK